MRGGGKSKLILVEVGVGQGMGGTRVSLNSLARNVALISPRKNRCFPA